MWGPQLSDIFSRVRYEPAHELDAAIEATGHKVEDIKKIIIGHLHLDHAGGLDIFLDRKDVEIWVGSTSFSSTGPERLILCVPRFTISSYGLRSGPLPRVQMSAYI